MAITAVGQTLIVIRGTEDVSKALRTVESRFEALASRLAAIGGGLTLSVSAPLALLSKNIMDSATNFEAWETRVKKTVAGTSAELDRLAAQLESLVGLRPLDPQDILLMAEYGGQVGLSAREVAHFADVAAKLKTAARLPEDFPLAFGQFLQITREAIPAGLSFQDSIDRVASALVNLGNRTPAVEDAVLNLMNRIAASGVVFGMTQPEIIGWAGAIIASGISAERGGTAFERTLRDIENAVISGGEQLRLFASTAGMSVQEFVTTWQQAPTLAFSSFLAGLKALRDQGQSATQVLQALGITEARQLQVLLTLAQNYPMVAKALEVAAQGYSENVALQQEFNRQAATTAARLQMLANNILLLKESLFGAAQEGINVFIEAATQVVRHLTEWARENPTLVRQLTVIGVALATVGPLMGLLGGSMMLLSAALRALFSPLLLVTEVFKALIGIVGMVLGIAGSLLGFLPSLAGAFLSLTGSVLSLAVSLGSVLVGALLAAGGGLLRFFAFMANLPATILGVAARLEALSTSLQGFITKALSVSTLTAPFRWFVDLASAIWLAIQALMGFIGSLASATLAAMLAAIPYIALAAIIGGALALLWKHHQRIFGFLADLMRRFFSWLGNLVASALQGLYDKVAAVWPAIVDIFKGAVTWLAGLLKRFFTWIVDLAARWGPQFWQVIRTGLVNVWNMIKDWASAVWDGIKGLWDGIVNIVKSAWQRLVDAAKSGIQGVINLMLSWIERIPGVGPQIAGALRDALGKVEEWAGQAAAALERITGIRLPHSAEEWRQAFDRFKTTLAEAWTTGKRLIQDFVAGDWEALRRDLGLVNAEFEDWFQRHPELAGLQRDLENLKNQVAANIQPTVNFGKALDALKDAGRRGAQGAADRFAELRKRVLADLALIDFKVKQGLLDPVSALQEKIRILQGYMEEAFRLGMVEEAERAAAELKKLGAQLEAMTGINPFAQMVDPLKEATQTLETLSRVAEQAMLRFRRIAAFRLRESDFAAGWSALYALIRRVIMDLARGFEDLNARQILIMRAITEALAEIIPALAGAVELAGRLADFTAPRGQIGALLAFLADLVHTMLATLDTEEMRDALSRAALISSMLKAAVEPLQTITTAAQTIAGFRARIREDAIENLFTGLSVVLKHFASFLARPGVPARIGEVALSAGQVKEAVEPLRSIVEALNAVATYTGMTNRIRVNVTRMVDHLELALRALARGLARTSDVLADIEERERDLGVLKGAMDTVKAMVDTLAAASGAFIHPRPLRFNLRHLVAQVNATLVALADVRFDLPLPGENELAGLRGALDVIKTAVDTLAGLSQFVPVVGNVGQVARTLTEQLLAAVSQLARGLSRRGFRYLLAEVEPTLAPLRGVLDVLGAAIETLTKLAAFSPPLTRIQRKVPVLAARLAAAVVQLEAELRRIPAGVLASAQAAGNALNPILGIMRDAVDTLERIARFVPALSAIRQKVPIIGQRIAAAAVQLAQELERVPLAVRHILKNVSFVTPLLDILGQAVDVFTKLARFEPQGRRIRQKVRALALALLAILEELRGRQLQEDVLNALRYWAGLSEDVGRLLSLVEGAVNALRALARPIPGNVGQLAENLTSALITLIQTLSTRLADLPAEVKATLPIAAAFSQYIRDLLDIVGQGVDALASIRDYVPVDMVGVQVARFTNDLLNAVYVLAYLIEQNRAALEAYIPSASDLAEDINALVDILDSGVDALANLRTYVPVENVAVQTARFANDLLAAVKALAQALVAIPDEVKGMIVAAGAMVQAIKDVLDVIREGVDALADLAKFRGVEDVGARAEVFASQLLTLASTLASYFAGASDEVKGAILGAQGLVSAIRDLVDLVGAGLEALTDLATSRARVTRATVEAFSATLLQVVTTLAEAIRGAGEPTRRAWHEAATWVQDIRQILDVIEPGIEGLTTLAQGFLVPSPGDIERFGSAIVDVVAGLEDALRDPRLEAIDLGALSEAMASVRKVVEVVEPGLTAIWALATRGVAVVTAVNLERFREGLLHIVSQLNQLALELEARRINVSGLAQFAEHLQSALEVAKEGLDVLLAFAQARLPGHLWTPLFDLWRDNLIALLERAQALLPLVQGNEAAFQALASVLGHLNRGVKDSIEALMEIRHYRPAGFMAAGVRAWLDNLEQALLEIQARTGRWLEEDLPTAIGVFAGVAEALRAGLESARGMIDVLRDFRPAAWLQGKLNLFWEQVGAIIESFRSQGQDVATGAWEAARQVADALMAAADFVISGLVDFVTALQVVDTGGQVLVNVLDVLTTLAADIEERGRLGGARWVQGWINGWGSMWGYIPTFIIPDILNTLDIRVDANIIGFDVGLAWATGIASGIRAGLPLIQEAVAQAVGALAVGAEGMGLMPAMAPAPAGTPVVMSGEGTRNLYNYGTIIVQTQPGEDPEAFLRRLFASVR